MRPEEMITVPSILDAVMVKNRGVHGFLWGDKLPISPWPWSGISEAMSTQLALALSMELSRCYGLSCLSPQSFNPSKVD